MDIRNSLYGGMDDARAIQQQGRANALNERVARNQFEREKQLQGLEDEQFAANDEQQGLRWVAGAADYVLNRPEALPEVVKYGQQKGYIDPNWDYTTLDPEELRSTISRLRDEAVGKLGGAQESQVQKAASATTAAKPSAIQEYEYVMGLPDDAAREQYFRIKRGERAPSTTIERSILDATDQGMKLRSNVARYENIAQEMERIQPPAGVEAKWREEFKRITGQEDAVTELRKDWNNLRVSAAVQNLPPGVASDKDIELVMSAFLPENANPQTVASFMRGLAKLEDLRADYQEFKADYLSQNASAVGLSKAWREQLNSYSDAPAPAGQPKPTMRFNPQTGQLEPV